MYSKRTQPLDMMILIFGLEFRGLFNSVPQMTEKYLILSLNLVKLYTDNSKFFHIRPPAPSGTVKWGNFRLKIAFFVCFS